MWPYSSNAAWKFYYRAFADLRFQTESVGTATANDDRFPRLFQNAAWPMSHSPLPALVSMPKIDIMDEITFSVAKGWPQAVAMPHCPQADESWMLKAQQ